MQRPGAPSIASMTTALLTTAFLCGGCTLARPTARATSATIERTSDEAGQVAIGLELANPGKDEIELVEYDYLVTLDDGSSYGGRWAALRALPPEQTVRASIPAVLPVASLRGGATSWRVSGILRYRDPQSVSRLLYEAGILETKVPFEGSGPSLERSPGSPAPAGAAQQGAG